MLNYVELKKEFDEFENERFPQCFEDDYCSNTNVIDNTHEKIKEYNYFDEAISSIVNYFKRQQTPIYTSKSEFFVFRKSDVEYIIGQAQNQYIEWFELPDFKGCFCIRFKQIGDKGYKNKY